MRPPGSAAAPDTWRRLHVFGGGAAFWQPVVAAAAALAGLLPAYEEAGDAGAGSGRVAAVLDHAAGTGDPVLVLPPGPEDHGDTAPGRHLRVMVPTDFTREEQRVLHRWAERAVRLGFDVHQLHVLDESTRPPMWEGAGHHAEAWHAELCRRHQLGDARLAVRAGDPVERILERSTGVDLILVCWRGDPGAGHARVVRQLLERTERPLLLVRAEPLAWAAAEPVGELVR